jgi:hypothetical protein
LKLALAHEEPERFLVQPTEMVDWRVTFESEERPEDAPAAVVDRQSAH